MKVYVVLNEKGGVGKTVSAKNIAKGFANSGQRVLLIDNDPQANATSSLNKESCNIMDLCENLHYRNENELIAGLCDLSANGTDLSTLYLDPSKTKDTIKKTSIENLDLLPCSLSLANTEAKIRNDVARPQQNRMKKILQEVRSDYDSVIIDCAPILNLLTINALCAATEPVIIPVKIDEGGLCGWAMTVQLIHQVADNFDIDLDYQVVFTMVQKTSHGWMKDCQKIIDLFNTVIPEKTCKTIIRQQARGVIKASFDKSFVVDQKSGVGDDYRNLILEIGRK